jgi:hypothetical protein
MEIVNWLNENTGAVVGVATAAYTVITLLLVIETRKARHGALAAELIATPEPWERARGLYVSVQFQNLGPSVARDADIDVWENEGPTVVGERLTFHQPYMPSGTSRTILPDKAHPGGARKLSALAAADVQLVVTWSWTDDRRSWFGLGPARRHARKAESRYDQLEQWFHRGEVIAERTERGYLEEIAEGLRKIETALAAIEKKL